MSIETLPFEHRPRNSIANNLDKINELIDWVNLDTHLYASASGERVTVDDTSSLKGLTVDGMSIQDGTPTPDAPVAVQVVGGANAWHESVREVGVPYTNVGITWTKNADGTYTANGTSTANAWAYAGTVQSIIDMAISLDPGIYTATTNAQRAALRKVSGGELYTLSNVFSSFTFTAEEGDSFFICPQVPSGTTVTNKTYYVQIVPGSATTPYVPYGSIGIVVGDTATPIDLHGNKLASLPDGTRDELHVDSTGHCVLTKRVQRLYFDGSSSSGWSVGGNYASTGGGYWLYANSQGAVGTLLKDTSYCDKLTYHNTSASSDLSGLTVYGNQAVAIRVHPFTPSGQMTVEQLMTWLQSNPLTFYVKYATHQTIDLGYIDPPAIPSGSVVTISASLTPEFHLEWWVDDGITALVDDLIAYIDYKTEG